VRGKILGLTNRDVVKRALSMVGYRPEIEAPRKGAAAVTVEGQYCMEGGRNGGDDPTRPHPFTIWQHPKKGTVATADCVGFGMWAQGADRKLEGRIHDYDGGWVNTDSACMDAAGDCELFEPCDPFPGCIIVYPSRRVATVERGTGRTVGKRIPGHWGTVVSVLPAQGRTKALVQVAHCHGPPLAGPAVSLADASLWLKHGGRYLRFKVARDVRS